MHTQIYACTNLCICSYINSYGCMYKYCSVMHTHTCIIAEIDKKTSCGVATLKTGVRLLHFYFIKRK